MKKLSLDNTRLDERYDIQNELGQGSYAEIYTARDVLASSQSPHRTVVIKALNVFLQNDLDADLERTLVENFQNEATALDRVRHPNIISRLGHGTARDLRNSVFHYLVLEYLPGGDLSKACREKSLPFAKALFYLEQICAGLGHAHKNGIIHRDIKPQNLLLTEDRQTVKIADFGVARVNDSDSPITRVGTNMFAPPEHSPLLAGHTETLTSTELTPAADVYSLAKSAYVLITCESPRFFTNKPISELPFAARGEPWAADLLKILEKATQENPRMRHQTVYDFWQELSSLKISAGRDAAENIETVTEISGRPHLIPQPRVAKGYTPTAPQLPQFDTSRELNLQNHLSAANHLPLVVRLDDKARQVPSEQPEIIEKEIFPDCVVASKSKRKNNFLKQLATYIIFVGLVAGILYATHNYLRGRGVLPAAGNPFNRQTGKVTTDVNLRPTSSNKNDPIGMIPKDSRVRIKNIKESWYEIEVIEYGRPKENADYADRGWVRARYVDIVE